MQDSSAAPSGPLPPGPPAAGETQERRRRRRVLLVAMALVLFGHLGFLGGLDAVPIGPGHAPQGLPVQVRTIEAPPPASPPAAPVAEPVSAVPAAPAPVQLARRPRVAREPASPREPPAIEAATSQAAPTVLADAAASAPAAEASAAAPASAPSEPPAVIQAEAAASAASAAASPPLLAAGQQPPPVYRTRFPPAATLRYQVRSGFLRGNGEIRWRPAGEAYSLALEARIAGLTLLKWSSDGAIDSAGLAPVRFLDQRARRAPQAANFQRESGKVTFSGPPTEWPLYAGTQDELSWMIQLAGIAAAEPGLLAEGGVIRLVVVGARGEARVWNVRYAGRENVDTAGGAVPAVKLVRERDGPYDRGYEIWLDPERGYLPAHVTRRSADGNADFDILLDRVDPAP